MKWLRTCGDGLIQELRRVTIRRRYFRPELEWLENRFEIARECDRR